MNARRAARMLALGIVVCAIALLAYRLLRSGHFGAKSAQPLSVTLSWNPSATATSYNVYRSSVSGGPYQKIGTSSVPQYEDKPVPSGVVLYYVVTSVGEKGESGYSTEIKAVVP